MRGTNSSGYTKMSDPLEKTVVLKMQLIPKQMSNTSYIYFSLKRGSYSNDARRRHPPQAGQISVKEPFMPNNPLLLGGKQKGRALG